VHRQPSGLRSSFVHLVVTAVVPHCVGPWTRLRTALEVILLRPRGPRSGPGCSVPVRHHLIGPIRPTRRHIAISPHGGLYAMPSLCGSAEATREWFRAFTAHSFLACRPLRPRGVRHRYPETSMPTLAFAECPSARHSHHSRNPFHAGGRFRGFSGSLALRPARLLAPLYWSVQPSRTFTSRLPTDRSPSPLLDITTTATGLLCWRDSHPLEWQLASLHGHSRPNGRALPAS
jgi:hypothetical protein